MLIYDRIYEDVQDLIARHGGNDPRAILSERGVELMPFCGPTRLLGMYKILNDQPFVFYNPDLDEPLLRMVFAHELGHDYYHREAATEGFIEYSLLDITGAREMEANIFAAHLLLDDDEVDTLAREGYSYDQLAALCEVNANLMVIKLSEMQRRGYALCFHEPQDSRFFAKIDGTDRRHLRPE